MKTIKYLSCVMAFSLGLSMASCDYLDKAPEGQVPTEEIDYTNISEMYMPVSGCYAKVRTSGMHWAIWELTVIKEQDVFSGQFNGSLYYKVGEYTYDDSFWAIDEIWKQYYNIIKVTNSALDALYKYEANCTSAADKSTCLAYQGEVRFIRAYAYFRLVQQFGPVTILRTNDQTDMQRSTIEAVYKYALEDLQFGMDNMPRLRPNQNTHIGAVTAFSAETLAAKIYANLKDYSKVEELTDDIINNGNFSLYPDYYQLWKIPGKLCDESIFECQCTDYGTGSGDLIDADQWFVCQGPENSGSDISGWGDCGIYTSFVDWAKARGETVRYTTSFLFADSTTPDGDVIAPQSNPINATVWNGKAYTPLNQLTPGRTKYGTNNNIRIFRYADVLLLNAEAKVRNGKNGDVPFNLVRRRAEMPELSGVTVDQILDERRMELVCEWGERYSDLLRSGKAAEELKNLNWSEDRQYFPIPYNQYTSNSDLLLDPKDE